MSIQINLLDSDFICTENLLVIIAKKDHIQKLETNKLPREILNLWTDIVFSPFRDDKKKHTTTWIKNKLRITFCFLPENVSRYNSPANPIVITSFLRDIIEDSQNDFSVIIILEKTEHAFVTACAIGRAFPEYSAKTKDLKISINIHLFPLDKKSINLPKLAYIIKSVRFAASLVDIPAINFCEKLFIDRELLSLSENQNIQVNILSNDSLSSYGLGGLIAVGMASLKKPFLAVLKYEPKNSRQSPQKIKTHVWIGKGIIFDTGGLNLKNKTEMRGMKRDFAGAAAVLAAFKAIVNLKIQDRIYGILCVAENSIGPNSLRPDDIVTLCSGRTVEIVNTDSEGRLLLADGLAYATKQISPDFLVTIGTLTDSQPIATGIYHAAIVSNNRKLEKYAIRAGLESGDLVHPLPFCPELFSDEFLSNIADMTNSVKNRNNARCACAAQFVFEHMNGGTIPWLNVDMTGPSMYKGRGTGFGVAFLVKLAQILSRAKVDWDR